MGRFAFGIDRNVFLSYYVSPFFGKEEDIMSNIRFLRVVMRHPNFRKRTRFDVPIPLPKDLKKRVAMAIPPDFSSCDAEVEIGVTVHRGRDFCELKPVRIRLFDGQPPDTLCRALHDELVNLSAARKRMPWAA